MLESLHIENIAVIRSIDLTFSSGFTVLSGETGAGKSVILESVRLLLGARFDKDLIRHGETSAAVSGIFSDVSTDDNVLKELGISPDEDGNLLLSRTFSEDGKSSIRINGKPSTLTVLREAGARLLSIHSQNSTSLLLDETSHRGILDAYADLSVIPSTYADLYRKLCKIRADIREYRTAASEKERMTDLLRYQISEIEAVSPKIGEEDKLLADRLKIRNREKIDKQAGFLYKALFGAEKANAHYLLSRSITAAESLSEFLPEAKEAVEKLTECLSTIDDVAESVYDAAGLENDGDTTELLDRIEEKLDGYARLRRKYGQTTEEILSFYRKAKETLARYDSAENELFRLEKEEKSCLAAIETEAEKLRAARRTAADRLTALVTDVLLSLDMPKVVFRIRIEDVGETSETRYNETGKDKVLFTVAANPGEEPKSISETASGGELSRIMLAIESVISEKEAVPTVIYDEVDTGVSGKTARKIGFRLAESAKKFQVFAITHSAQIASLADTHYAIMKKEVDGRAETHAKILSQDERIEELARILGGIRISDAQRRAAVDLLSRNEAIEE